jgi:hypothetical protein
MTEAVQSLQALLGRLSSFFDIFDLSFIVSGGSSLAALLLVYKLHSPTAFPDWMQGAYGGILLVLACYVLGMLSFVLGRLLRRLLHFLLSGKPFAQRLARQIADALQQHELQPKADDHSPLARCILALAPLQDPKSRRGKPDPVAQSAALRLYALMWTQVRQQSTLAPSQVLLNRYWVMAALCDGMVVAAALWLGVLLVSMHRLESMQLLFLGRLGLVLSGLAMLLFLREAERYAQVQVDDLVATLAWEMSRPSVVAQPGSPSASAVATDSAAASSSPASSSETTASSQPGHPAQ